MDKQRVLYDIITDVWRLIKPYLAMVPLTQEAWAELVSREDDLQDMVRETYGADELAFAAGMMRYANDYIAVVGGQKKEDS